MNFNSALHQKRPFHSDRSSAVYAGVIMVGYPYNSLLLRLQTPLQLGVWGQSLPKTMWEINFPLCLGQNASLYRVILH